MAPFSVRAFAFALDIVASALAAGVVTAQLEDPTDLTRQLIPYGVLLVEQVILVALTGQTLGMRLMGTKVVRLSDVDPPAGLPDRARPGAPVAAHCRPGRASSPATAAASTTSRRLRRPPRLTPANPPYRCSRRCS